MKKQSGWWVPHPYFLREEPTDARDLVVPMSIEADDDVDDLYSTEAAAWAVATAQLDELRDQALKDIAFLSRPYTSPRGITYIVPQEKTDAWRSEARKRLRIAEAGLALCPR